MHENDDAPTWKNNIRASGQSLYLQSKTQTGSVKMGANLSLRRRILTLDAGHHAAAAGRIDDVDHASVARDCQQWLFVSRETGPCSFSSHIGYECLRDCLDHRHGYCVAKLPVRLGI